MAIAKTATDYSARRRAGDLVHRVHFQQAKGSVLASPTSQDAEVNGIKLYFETHGPGGRTSLEVV
jgi:hypothetical protein